KGTKEFYQVNTFFHLNKLTKRFHKALAFGQAFLYLDSNMRIPPAIKYNYTETNSLWLHNDHEPVTLEAFSRCFLESINAFFSPTEFQLCFGWNKEDRDFLVVQDPSIIYH